MAYQTAAIWMTVSDLCGHSSAASLSKYAFFHTDVQQSTRFQLI